MGTGSVVQSTLSPGEVLNRSAPAHGVSDPVTPVLPRPARVSGSALQTGTG